ncbi:uncharacterized protein KY384_001497 [Bacidia gigantensis]|uniref:uncharacterized protein n=1 Tax=Bacidia gigantensis TaxID=2732470 RepID=UPI001D03A607|nr:uncharacterized protein KY384_001497 [Bacidia gigantensis]KAG8533756.1 hypothetical protein KY384_001497 [Bacidia gigantensis]
MDLNSIKDQVSNLSLYDLKAGVRKVQNVLPDVGASQLLNEIMPMIYKRFTEKAAEEWRQIYKALQLLEFLIKNGSERVIDDARSHLSLLKMLRQFHYIDQNGKDQGINVRNRSKELADLLGDVDRIRSERKKARANRNKFGGVEGGAMTGGMAGGSRYGGFGSEEASYGGYSGGVYGDGGGFGGREPNSFQDSSNRRDRYQEYDEYDEDGSAAPARRKPDVEVKAEMEKSERPKPKEPEQDLFSFDDDVPPQTPPKDFSSTSSKPASFLAGGELSSLQTNNNDDDDFDDFQSATPKTTTSSKQSIPPSVLAPVPMAPSQGTNLNSLAPGKSLSPAPSFSSNMASTNPPSLPNQSISSPPAPNYNISMSSPPPMQPRSFVSPQVKAQPQPQQPRQTSYQASAPNYFTSVPAPQQSQPPNASTIGTSRPTISSANSFSNTNSSGTASKPSVSGGDAFGSLWSTASSTAGIKKSSTGIAAQGPNLASMQREKASQGLWGHSASGKTVALPSTMGPGTGSSAKSGGALDDLLG